MVRTIREHAPHIDQRKSGRLAGLKRPEVSRPAASVDSIPNVIGSPIGDAERQQDRPGEVRFTPGDPQRYFLPKTVT